MNKLHIGISELDKRNLSYEEFFRIIHVTVRYKTFYLKELYHSYDISDMDAYPLLIVEKIINITRTLHSVINRDHDYIVANIIVRSLADCISSLAFIYTEPDLSLKSLRHYLFVMDGLKGRINKLPKDIKYDGRIKKEEFNQLKKQIENKLDNYSRAYEFAQEQIKQLRLYKENTEVINNFIENTNWKFKNFKKVGKPYSWNELYGFMSLPIDTTFFSSLSEFVHGLSTSNLQYDDDYESFEPIIGITSSLLGKVSEILDKIYYDDIPLIQPKMIEALYDSDMPSHYVEHIIKSASKGK